MLSGKIHRVKEVSILFNQKPLFATFYVCLPITYKAIIHDYINVLSANKMCLYYSREVYFMWYREV